MSFKSTVQSLLDLFPKKSEAEWIGSQCLPSAYANSTVDETGTGSYQDYVAPISGWLSLTISQAYSYDNAKRYRLITAHGSICAGGYKLQGASVGCYLPCQKGETIRVFLDTGVPYELIWVKSLGSSS